MSFFKGSPSRWHYSNNNDLEAGGSQSGVLEESFSSNASRQLQIRKRLARDNSPRAVSSFKAAGEQRANVSGTLETSPSPPSSGDFAIGQDQLALLSGDHNVAARVLEEHRGVKGLLDLLKTNLEKGIKGDNDNLRKRKSEFGLNTYPREKGRSFWMFLWEAWKNLTLIILIVVAVTSLALGIKTQGIKEGWYDGGSIAFAVILVIVVKDVGKTCKCSYNKMNWKHCNYLCVHGGSNYSC